MKIAFITDGSKEMGMGHIMRALTIANEIPQIYEISFLTLSDKAVQDLISSKGFNAFHFTEDESLIASLERERFDTIIIDRPPVSPTLVKRIRNSCTSRIVLMDSDIEAAKYATIAVNGLKAQDFVNKKFTDSQSGTKHYIGPKYLILKPQFDDYRKKIIRSPETASKILLIFGGSDPLNLTCKTLRGLLEMTNKNLEISVILGPSFGFHAEIKDLIQEFDANEQVTVLNNIDNVAEIMSNAELVFTSAGLSMFEALVVGCNVIVASQNKLQRENYDYFFKRFNTTPKKFSIINETFILTQSDSKVDEMEIGMGRNEVIGEIIRN